MHLKMLFNLKYFWQNIKKSKAVIIAITCLIPLVNAVTLLNIANNMYSINIIDIIEVSIINIICMYVVPIVLSITLLGFVFGKKSVDFMNSLPLTRKEIFLTNTFGGILIIVFLQVINTIILLLEGAIFTNIIVPLGLVFDYFVIWTVSYIFVFCVSNLALSVSGNRLTMIVVTLLILFFVPFMHNYITGFGREILARTDDYTYIQRAVKYTEYTLPYNIFASLLKADFELYSLESIIKMVILTILYIVFGNYLFKRRKMENNEMSFKNIHIHYIVKSLTLIPMATLSFIILDGKVISEQGLLMFVLLLSYNLIYDLIVSKTNKKIKLSIIYFISTILITFGIYKGVYYLNNENNYEKFLKEEIKEVGFYVPNIDYLSYEDSVLKNIYFDNKTAIDIVKKCSTKQYLENVNSMAIDEGKQSIKVNVKTESKKEYIIELYLLDKDYNYLIEFLSNSEKYVDKYGKIDYNKLVLSSYDNISFSGEELESIKDTIKKNNSTLNFKEIAKSTEKIEFYAYQNHKVMTYSFNMLLSDDLKLKIITLCNKDTIRKLQMNNNAYIIDVSYIKDNDSYFKGDLYYYSNKICQFILNNKDEKVNLDNCVCIRGYIYSSNYAEFVFYTSNIEELQNIIPNDDVDYWGDYDE